MRGGDGAEERVADNPPSPFSVREVGFAPGELTNPGVGGPRDPKKVISGPKCWKFTKFPPFSAKNRNFRGFRFFPFWGPKSPFPASRPKTYKKPMIF